MEPISDINAVRKQAILSSLAGFPFLLMMGFSWIAAGALSYLVPRDIVPFIYWFSGVPAVPIALALERRVGYVPHQKPDPLLPLMLQLMFIQVIAFPAFLPFLSIDPGYFPVALAAVVGAHLLPFQWVYRTRIYGVLVVVIAIAPICARITASRQQDSLYGLSCGYRPVGRIILCTITREGDVA